MKKFRRKKARGSLFLNYGANNTIDMEQKRLFMVEHMSKKRLHKRIRLSVKSS
jgi:hypothetical protein